MTNFCIVDIFEILNKSILTFLQILIDLHNYLIHFEIKWKHILGLIMILKEFGLIRQGVDDNIVYGNLIFYERILSAF